MVALIIPVFNGGDVYAQCLKAIDRQAFPIQRKIVMESGSSDRSRHLSLEHGFEVHDVPKGTFDHGGTRTQAVKLVDDEIVVFLTQDVILDDPGAIGTLVAAFDDPTVAGAYGRQIPHHDANPVAAHSRLTSYGPRSYVAEATSEFPVGIRKCFMSNAFAAYRRSALLAFGGFPDNMILSEDMYATAKLMEAGWKIAYVAEAQVRHSHNYTVAEEFRRYFDIGVFHKQQHWILDEFGAPVGEGIRTALHQLRHFAKTGAWHLIPRSLAISGAKYLGYKLGLRHAALGPRLSRKLAMHRGFFAEKG